MTGATVSSFKNGSEAYGTPSSGDARLETVIPLFPVSLGNSRIFNRRGHLFSAGFCALRRRAAVLRSAALLTDKNSTKGKKRVKTRIVLASALAILTWGDPQRRLLVHYIRVQIGKLGLLYFTSCK